MPVLSTSKKVPDLVIAAARLHSGLTGAEAIVRVCAVQPAR
ncbi:MAG: hypothetical protein FD153_1749 [Rhodospirillaceae bacterium]|nr:MAG: hypothetical protein FD153_1749 [Rhodospirillaceae bacterium]